ncbi:MAG: hypothetical protein EOM91_18045 [Sphingobacteriia bacterium]|nr:hypothetical protein [Sphingobacteriia bacterium]
MLVSFFPGIEIPPFRELTRGAIVGVATVVDCLEPRSVRRPYPLETLSWWPITHMVAPKEQALGCGDCHVQAGSRLASVEGVYLPGRDHNRWIDILGTLLVAGTLGGILVHGLFRFFSPSGRSQGGHH